MCISRFADVQISRCADGKMEDANEKILTRKIVNCLSAHSKILLTSAHSKIITMPWIEYVGLFGAFLSAITFIPQVLQAWRTKSVADLSLWMLLIVFLSVIVWLVYGFYLMLLPVIIANSIILILAIVLLVFKYTFRKKPLDEQDRTHHY